MDELREGKLSDKNHRYLHGRDVEGCTLSTCEKRSRQRVVDGPYDPRLREAKFLNATIVVSNNDAKYQINKDRAKAYARDAQTPLHWSVAQDKAGAEALQTQDCDKEAKIRWLQYHDMDTEGLCGMLPLAVGLRVALTHHMDRSEERCLLKGHQAFVHSWDWKENDQQPSVVCPVQTDKDCAPAVAVCFLTAPHTRRAQPRYVKFLDAEWTLDGAQEPGLYPIVPETRQWFLDKGRKYSVLEVKRKQIPLVPAFAITAHASQGKTLLPGKNGKGIRARKHKNRHSHTHAAPGRPSCSTSTWTPRRTPPTAPWWPAAFAAERTCSSCGPSRSGSSSAVPPKVRNCSCGSLKARYSTGKPCARRAGPKPAATSARSRRASTCSPGRSGSSSEPTATPPASRAKRSKTAALRSNAISTTRRPCKRGSSARDAASSRSRTPFPEHNWSRRKPTAAANARPAGAI